MPADLPLALKYRPATWGDLVGQEHVRAVLEAAVERQRSGRNAPAAFLFSGPKGTGKTTSARILAAALNCEAAAGADPCGSCQGCAMTAAGSADVIEVDAAGHGRVDDVRQLVEQAAYMGRGRHRVFILDEAHAMSEAGFNALLKTLEEPPPGTTFVLVTTEAHKIIDPVLSRCMALAFQPVTPALVAGRLERICGAESIPFDPGALELIAERADGGLRDAIMALDQVASLGDVTEASYARVFGTPNFAPAFLDACSSGDLARALDVAEDYARRAGDPARLIDDCVTSLARRLRDDPRAPRRRLVGAMRALWDVRAGLRGAGVAPRAAMAVVMAEVAAELADLDDGPPPAAAPEPPAGAELAGLLGAQLTG